MRAILTYHSIDASGSPISLSRDAFARHVAWMATGRVRVTSVDELLRLPDTVDALAVTFDDGFRNFAEVAAPLLEDHGIPASVFVVTGHVGGTNRWRGTGDAGVPELPLLSWDEIGRLAERGVTIGAHTRTHAPLAGLSLPALDEELEGPAREIETRLGSRPRGLAYPYGSVDGEAASVARRHYPWACTTDLRALREGDDAAALPRLDAYYFREPRRLERWGTARFRSWLSVRRQARRIRQRWIERQGAR